MWRGWVAALAAELFLIFPGYSWLAGGGPLPELLETYVLILPFLGGFLIIVTLPVMIVASALARRFEAQLMAAPVLWAHLSAGLVFVVIVAAGVLLEDGIDLADAGERGALLQLALALLVATESFLRALPRER
ncbi:hypothetical protein ACXN5S_05120 [Pseudoroseicyclus sp. H15]